MSEIVLPEVKLNLYNRKNPVEVTIVENKVVTTESSPNFIRHITFDLSGTELAGNIQAGQAMGIQVPGTDDKGRPHKIRLYSVSSPTNGEQNNPNYVSTTVKRVIEEWDDNSLYLGLASNYVSNLKPGDKVLMTGPSGKTFLLPDNKTDFNYVFFATGTGIAPFRGMVMDLIEAGAQGNMALLFGCPYRTDVLYQDYFKQLQKDHANFGYHIAISREDRRTDGSKKYVQTLIEDADGVLDTLKQPNTLIYICGLRGMETGIYQSLVRNGLSDYVILRPELQNKPHEEWTWEEWKKGVKGGSRMFEEVY
jgi:ferredoxin--NADP+ reductase